MKLEEKVIFQVEYQGNVIAISEENMLFINGTLQDKDSGIPFGIPMLSTTSLNGEIKKIASSDIKVRAHLRHTGIGTNITIFINNTKLLTKHVIAPLF